MEQQNVTIFRPYPFTVDQKIRIEGGPRNGDWEVIGITANNIGLRCPISFREFEWNRFCYFSEKRSGVTWPNEDEK